MVDPGADGEIPGAVIARDSVSFFLRVLEILAFDGDTSLVWALCDGE